MSISCITYDGISYPAFQAEGNAAQFAIPFAQQVCSGTGYDIGCPREEWSFPGAIMVDSSSEDEYHAMNLPDGQVDYIFSSHCLEHTDDWVASMDYWYSKLVPGGVLFLYLPHYSQVYWRPWNNRKHKHSFTMPLIRDYMEAKGYTKVHGSSGADLNGSFMIMGEKPNG